MCDVVVLVHYEDDQFRVVEELRDVFELSVHWETKRRFGLEKKECSDGTNSEEGLIECGLKWVKIVKG